MNSDNERAMTSMIKSWSTLRAMRECTSDDHREQSSGQFEEQRDRRESHPVGAGNDENDTQCDGGEVGGED